LPDFPFSGTVTIIVIANLLNRLAYTTRITNAALLQVHGELEECARVCGATNISIIAKVIWPLVKSSLIFSALWTALLTFREVSMAMFLTETKNTVLSVAIWRLWEIGHLGQASAAVMVMVGISTVLLMGIMALAGGRATDRTQGTPFGSSG
ncbi:MAG TPA: ABC transporter permease subunit, partial [Candidatus Binatia bacterium]